MSIQMPIISRPQNYARLLKSDIMEEPPNPAVVKIPITYRRGDNLTLLC